jgi:hypothetical protein
LSRIEVDNHDPTAADINHGRGVLKMRLPGIDSGSSVDKYQLSQS